MEAVGNNPKVTEVQRDHLHYGGHVCAVHSPPVGGKHNVAVPVGLLLEVLCFYLTLGQWRGERGKKGES